MNDQVRQTLLARVYDVAEETPLEHATKLSDALGTEVHLKREDLQPVHSFKIRGAYNKIAQLTKEEQGKGVIAASAGNHAQGVALSAKKLGIRATIVMPRTTPSIKVDAVKGYGAEVVLHGDSYSDAYVHCMELVQKTGMTFVHPFDDPLVIAGQGTVGREILEQLPHVTHIFVPVGGGGLIGGVAQYVKTLKPEVKVIGVEPDDANAMQVSLQKGERVTLDHVGIFADGVAVKQVGELTFKLAQQYVDEVITVSNDQICAAIKMIFEETRSIVEPAGALGTAGLAVYAKDHDLKDAQCVAICSGANMSFERLQFVAERTLVGSGKEALFSVAMPEHSGALRTFCSEVVSGHAITEFNYRLQAREQAHIFVGISVSGEDDKQAFMHKMSKAGYEYQDLSHDDLAKEHVRHMIGGRGDPHTQELIYEVNFPERPGALGDFLATLDNEINISLFHYRGQGLDTGRVLIGFETRSHENLVRSFAGMGYNFIPASSRAIRTFLRGGI
jgi:threonine dehydratase